MDGVKTFVVLQEHELRLEVEHKKSMTVTLLKGTAELFGAELPRDQPLTFHGTKLAIFTWHGATLEVRPARSYS
jgi:polyribonucleotide 5'-hydroxyl-kinase